MLILGQLDCQKTKLLWLMDKSTMNCTYGENQKWWYRYIWYIYKYISTTIWKVCLFIIDYITLVQRIHNA